MNLPNLKLTPLGIFYKNSFYKHECYDFFTFYKDSIYFYKYFQNGEKNIFTINNLDKDELNQILVVLGQI